MVYCQPPYSSRRLLFSGRDDGEEKLFSDQEDSGLDEWEHKVYRVRNSTSRSGPENRYRDNQGPRTGIVTTRIIFMHLCKSEVLPLHFIAFLQIIHIAEKVKAAQRFSSSLPSCHCYELAGPGTTESGCSLAPRSHASNSSH